MSRVQPASAGPTNEQRAELKRIFDRLDSNGDGFLSRKEFDEAVQDARRKNVGKFNTNVIMMEADGNADKLVTFDEFVDAAVFTTNQRGQSTAQFNSFLRVVAAYHLPYDKQDYLEEYRPCPPPVFMLCFSIIQIATFIYYSEQECADPSLECPLSFSSKLAFRPGCREQVWRFFTYMFVHAGWGHIVFNLIIQLLIGIPLEMVHGPFRVAALYLVGVVAGSLASSVCDPEANVVGASAGVYALLGAHIADVFINWAEMPFRWLRAALLFVLVSLDMSLSIYNRYFSDDPGANNVSYTGHFAGAVVGCTLGTAILRNLKQTDYEVVLKYVGIGIVAVGFVIAFFFNIFYDYRLTSCP